MAKAMSLCAASVSWNSSMIRIRYLERTASSAGRVPGLVSSRRASSIRLSKSRRFSTSSHDSQRLSARCAYRYRWAAVRRGLLVVFTPRGIGVDQACPAGDLPHDVRIQRLARVRVRARAHPGRVAAGMPPDVAHHVRVCCRSRRPGCVPVVHPPEPANQGPRLGFRIGQRPLEHVSHELVLVHAGLPLVQDAERGVDFRGAGRARAAARRRTRGSSPPRRCRSPTSARSPRFRKPRSRCAASASGRRRPSP